MDYKFTKTDISSNKIEAYSHLLSLVFPNTTKFTKDFMHWQYVLNPNGNVVGYDAYCGTVLAGHYVTIPVSYIIKGKITKGLLSLNTATHPDHRGKGLFTQLANKTYDEAKTLGYKFIIGVANQNSTHGFLKKLGFYLIAPLLVKTGVGSISYKKESDYTAFPNWTELSIKWRLNNPNAHYYKSKSGVVSKTDKKGIYADLFQGHIFDATIKTKNPSLKLWIGLAKDIKCKGVFINLPQKLRPSPLNLIFKDLTGELPKLTEENILFESIDFDGY